VAKGKQFVGKMHPIVASNHSLRHRSKKLKGSPAQTERNPNVIKIQQVCQFLNQFAPIRLAEEWDNVGLLTGDRESSCKKIMTCLTVTPESAAEAIEEDADLIVSHHPLPFRPLKRITTDSIPSKLVWDLARANVAIYSPHTGFDSALEGINQSLAEKIGLEQIKPLTVIPNDEQNLGAGRVGKTAGGPQRLPEFVNLIKKTFDKQTIKLVGQPDHAVEKVAVACGSGGSFLSDAIRVGCDTFVTGEASFHSCLEAQAAGVNLILIGHYDSERFAVEMLADRLAAEFSDARVWASAKESDPIEWW
jgi:dinuclear metal center YbgI/SA1388 family protein